MFPKLLPAIALVLLFAGCQPSPSTPAPDMASADTTFLAVKDERLPIAIDLPIVCDESVVEIIDTPPIIVTDIIDTSTQDLNSLVALSNIPLLDVSEQVFNIGVSKDTIIFGQKGTRIHITKDLFIRQHDSLPVTGEISVSLKEYYSIADFIAGNLSTNYNDQILETGGTVFIEVFSNGEPCLIQPGKSLELSFPTTDTLKNMQAFSGEFINDQIKWELMPKALPSSETEAQFPGGQNAFVSLLERNLILPEELLDSIITDPVQVVFTIDQTGAVTNLTFTNNPHPARQAVVRKAFARMPRWKPASRNGRPITAIRSLNIFFEGQGSDVDRLVEQFEPTLSNGNIDSASIANLGYYVLSAAKIGWINCDRLYYPPQGQTSLFVKLRNPENADVNIILHSVKSVLQGTARSTGIYFSGIPAGEKLTILAIKKEQDGNYISISEHNSSERTVNALAFEKLTVEQLQTKIDGLKRLSTF